MKTRSSVLPLSAALLALVVLCAMAAGPMALAQAPAVPAKAQADGNGPPLKPHVVASFNNDWYTSFKFLESITVGPDGYLYVTSDEEVTGQPCQIVRLSPDGRHRDVFATSDPILCATGGLLGLAFDEHNRLHVAALSTIPGTTGVYRANDDGTLTQVMNMPDGTTPNGIAFYGDDLYVSDWSWPGGIYRKRPHDPKVITAPWFQDPNLLGPNGIAFYRDALYIALSAVGQDASGNPLGEIVRTRLQHDGSPGPMEVVAPPDPRLFAVDGVAFDVEGRLWLAMNAGSDGLGGGLGTMDEDGTVQILADNPGWLDYPTQMAFGNSFGTRDTMFITNGGFNLGHPNVISLKVGVAGVQLPVEDWDGHSGRDK